VSFLRKLFGASADAPADGPGDGGRVDDAEWMVAKEASFDASADRHRVTIWLRLLDPTFEVTREQLKVFALENEVMRALDAAGAGEHDTNALERGFMAIRLIGDDADELVRVITPLIGDVTDGSYLAVRRGPAGTGEDRIELGGGVDKENSD
jgi:hypothetical protein